MDDGNSEKSSNHSEQSSKESQKREGQYRDAVSPMVFLVEPEELVDCAEGATIAVSGAEGRHGALVKRLEAEEHVHLVDGRGVRAASVVMARSGRWD